MCKYKPSLTKIKTSYIVVLLNSTNCRFADYKGAVIKYWGEGGGG